MAAESVCVQAGTALTAMIASLGQGIAPGTAAELSRLEALDPFGADRYAGRDIGSGNLFADFYRETVRFVRERRCWYVYDGKAWRADTGGLLSMERCKHLARLLMLLAVSVTDDAVRELRVKQARRWDSRCARETVLKDASGVHSASVADFDRDPFLLNCENGTLNLKTGAFWAHRPEDMLTMVCGAAYDPAAQCERWEQFMDEVMGERLAHPQQTEMSFDQLPPAAPAPWKPDAPAPAWKPDDSALPWETGAPAPAWKPDDSALPWETGASAPPWEPDDSALPWETDASAPAWKPGDSAQTRDADAPAPAWKIDDSALPWDAGASAPARKPDDSALPWETDASAPAWKPDDSGPARKTDVGCSGAGSTQLTAATQKKRYLQKALGYALTGDTRYECLFILYGATTRNGKGTTMETILRLMGDYGKTASPETIGVQSAAGARGPSEDVARLAGARFVNISEPDKKLTLSAALVKQLTGNDTITARFLHENSFEYRPRFKMFINTNYLPQITDQTLFSSGRVKTIPFERHFAPEEQDRGLKELFARPESLSGILNWCLDGLSMLQSEGFSEPQAVLDATQEYARESDKILLFLGESMERAPGVNTRTSEVYARYKRWCEENGYCAENVRNFRALLSQVARVERKRPCPSQSSTTMLLDYKVCSESEWM